MCRASGCIAWVCIAIYFIYKELTRRGRGNDHPSHLLVLCQPSYISTAVNLNALIHGSHLSPEYETYARYACWALSGKFSCITFFQVLNVVIIGLSLITPLFASLVLKRRLYAVILALSVPALLLSVNYDAIFLVGICFHLVTWVEIEYESAKRFARNNRPGNQVRGNIVNPVLLCLFTAFPQSLQYVILISIFYFVFIAKNLGF